MPPYHLILFPAEPLCFLHLAISGDIEMLGLHPLGGPQPTRLLQRTGDAGSSPEAHMGAQPCSSKTGCGDTLPGHHLSPEILLLPGLPLRLCRKPGPVRALSPGGTPSSRRWAGDHTRSPQLSEHSHLVVRAGPHLLCHPFGSRRPLVPWRDTDPSACY